MLTGKDLTLCPVREKQLVQEREPQVVAEYDRSVELYFPNYERGNLLISGGLGDQSARYIAYMQAIADTRDTIQLKWNDELKRREDEARRNQPR